MAYNYPLDILKSELQKCQQEKDSAEKACGDGIYYSKNLAVFSINIKKIEQLEAAIKFLTDTDFLSYDYK